MVEFWLFAGLILVFVSSIFLLPIWQQKKINKQEDTGLLSTDAYDAEVFKRQLQEIERDRESGTLSVEEAEAARVEIARRLLLLDQKKQSDTESLDQLTVKKNSKIQYVFSIVIVLILAGGTVTYYLSLGNPAMPNMPYAEREAERIAAEQKNQNNALSQQILDVKQQAEIAKDDLGLWRQLGHLYLQDNRPAEAVFAFAEALRIDRTAPGVLIGYVESQVISANGAVDEQLNALLQEALSYYPHEPRARYYNALHDYQFGRIRAGLNKMVVLLQDAPVGAGWYGPVRGEVLRLSDEAGVDVFEEIQKADQKHSQDKESGTIATAQNKTNAPKLSPNQLESMGVENMSAQERQEMIVSMVDSLAARLQDMPDDEQGWRRLAQSATVLGRVEQVEEAYENLFRLLGRTPTLLTQKAEALMALNNGQPNQQVLSLMTEVLQKDPQNMQALWFSGMAALSIGDKNKAEQLFMKVLGQLPESSNEYQQLKKQISNLLNLNEAEEK